MIACTRVSVAQTRFASGLGMARCVKSWSLASSPRVPFGPSILPKRDGLRLDSTTFSGFKSFGNSEINPNKSKNENMNYVLRRLVATSALNKESVDGPREKDILSSAEKKELRSMAGRLGKRLCVHQIGRSGLQESGIKALRDALVANELVKVKLGGNCPLEMDEAIEIVESELASNIIGTIGNTFIIYKPNYDIKSKLRAAVQAAREAKQAGRTSENDERL
mmetsp:Transcript_16616/g.32083  ORF Transcript_16616/g.32083 Transcript_16616/m.32083 type:complete len:222 (+) Transcript_16616:3-668(+)